MADKAAVKARLADLIDRKRPFCVQINYVLHVNIIVASAADANFFKFVEPWSQATALGKGSTNIIPEGLVQFSVPYDEINTIVEFEIENNLYSKIPPETLNVFKNRNVEDHVNVR